MSEPSRPWRQMLGPELAPLAEQLTLEKVLTSRDGQRIMVCFLSSQLIKEKAFLQIKRALVYHFMGVRVSLRIACPALASDFVSRIGGYTEFLNTCLLRHFPAARVWMGEVGWQMQGKEELLLTLPHSMAVEYFEKNLVMDRIARIIDDVFRLKLTVRAQISGDAAKRLEEIRAERELEEKRFYEESVKPAIAQSNKPKAEAPKSRSVYGRVINDPAVAVNELREDSGKVAICGEVMEATTKELRGGESVLLIFSLTDYQGTMPCKAFLSYKPRMRRGTGAEADASPPTEAQRAAVQAVVDAVKPGAWLKVLGDCQMDTYARELTLMVSAINLADKPMREDNAQVKRVELHLHTQMSSMDGVSSASALIARAAAWGHPAVAITDHGVLQAFPEAFAAAAKHKIKLIPGVEGYLTDEGTLVHGADDRPLTDPIVVLDFETTGLNPRKNRVIEVGAVRMQNGQVVEEFSAMVHPGVSIPPRITEITGITDAMLVGAKDAGVIMPQLIDFIGEAAVAAHNAPFDMAFLQEECARLGLDFAAPVMDTLELSRRLYPQLKSHKLGAVCKALGVSLKNAHRAVHDARATAHVLIKMIQEAERKDITTLSQLAAALKGGTIGDSHHIILLAASQKGMENLNRMVSEGHLKYFRRRPHIPREVLQRYREGVIVGSACEAGELFQAVLNGKDEQTLSRIARFYDYLEIQPIDNNAFLLRDGQVADEEGLRALNRKIVSLGEKLGLPVVATGDVHFLEPRDAICRAVLMAGQGFKDADEQAPLYFKSTDEMRAAFAYLGETKAQEVVIDNPLRIAAKIEKVTLFPSHPEGKETFQPFWPDAADNIRGSAMGTAHARYGDVLPEVVQARLDKELKSIIGYGFATLYNIAQKLVQKSLSDGYLVGSRGSVGSSLVATMCGITEVNPLPPHYRCPQCRFVDFEVAHTGAKVGVDLPPRDCPACGAVLVRDGFDIPFEVFLGFKGDKVPDIDLNFSGVYQPHAHAYVEELFGKGNCFRAGTIGTLADKTAYGYVSKYFEERNIPAGEAEKRRVVQGCVGVKRTTGQHPGGMVVLPNGYEIYQFTAIQHPADDQASSTVTTHYDFGSMHDVLVKLDILGHDDPTMIRMLQDLTGIDPLTLPLNDPKVMSLFTSPKALGVTVEQIDCSTGTLGIPEFGTRFVRQMLEQTQPTKMEELIRISGLSHGTDVWLGNAQELIENGTATLSECICTRDDIMNQLIALGVDSKMAFDTMESVRKGKGLRPDMEQAMVAQSVPEWFITACKKIGYMFPKGHAVAYVMMALRIAWFKVYRPEAYYAAYFTIRAVGFDAKAMSADIPGLRDQIEELAAKGKAATAKEKDQITLLEIGIEMKARGIAFAPVDLYDSDAEKFQIKGPGVLLMPIMALPGMGEAASQGIVQARIDGIFLSVEDFKARAKVSSANIDALRELGCLKDMPETSQVSLFSLVV